MELEYRQIVYRRAIDTFGEEAQLWMVIEEMSELAKEICKFQRGKRSWSGWAASWTRWEEETHDLRWH